MTKDEGTEGLSVDDIRRAVDEYEPISPLDAHVLLDLLQAAEASLDRQQAVVEAAQVMVDNHRERKHWTARSIVELEAVARALAALTQEEP